MKWHTGTSGFHYDDWKELFYPIEVKKKDWLSYYATHFETVEINNTFYGTPSEKTVQGWYDKTPDEFLFTIKGNRYVTHINRLKDPEEGVSNVYHSIEPLREKVGCVLWQLPGSLTIDCHRLRKFAAACSHAYTNVVEFRDPSWYTDEVLAILEAHKLTYCMISAPDNLPELATATSEVGYLRFHGKKEWYRYAYSEKELLHWIRKVSGTRVNEAYVYFNNDYEANAIKNARTWIEKTG